MYSDLKIESHYYKDIWDWRTPVLRAFRQLLKMDSFVTIYDESSIHVSTSGQEDLCLLSSRDYEENKEFFDFLKKESRHFRANWYSKKKTVDLKIKIPECHLRPPNPRMKNMIWPRFFVYPYHPEEACTIPMKGFERGFPTIEEAAKLKRLYDSIHPDEPTCLVKKARTHKDYKMRNIRSTLSKEEKDKMDGILYG